MALRRTCPILVIVGMAAVLVGCSMGIGQRISRRYLVTPSESPPQTETRQTLTHESDTLTDVKRVRLTPAQATFLEPTSPPMLKRAMPSVLPSQIPTETITSTFDMLMAEEVPESDLREIAMRLRGALEIPITVGTGPENYQLGDTIEFSATNLDSDANFTLTARLVYQTSLVYFFAEQGVDAEESLVRGLVDDFEQNTYPVVRAFFGSEWTPGVDGDPHLYILYATGLGSSVAGYYSSADEYSRLAHEFSNEKEMFYINASVVALDDQGLPGTLAHEFQHMVHWSNDPNEDTWMNEGASVLAEYLTGHVPSRFDHSFIHNPDLQLNAWSEVGGGSESSRHYGASFLFLTYFLDRFGDDATRALLTHKANGMQAVDAVMLDLGAADQITGQPISDEDLFADWVVANYLGDTGWADGQYGYHNYDFAPRVELPTDAIHSCHFETLRGTVHQYAADYIDIRCEGDYTLSFSGSQKVRVVPADPHSGKYVFWGNRHDSSDTTLTREFDLSAVDSATLTYWAWWSIEKNYDYAYVEVSTDGGDSWLMLETPKGTAANPTGNNLGWGYHHNSGGEEHPEWVQENVDLTYYAGDVIQVRFEYITDGAINRPGMMLDDINVPEIGYEDDIENGSGGWNGHGWVRFDNLLPQTWIVQIVRQDERSVTRIPLESGQGMISLTGPAILVVSGTTPFTTESAAYEIVARRQ